MNTYFTNRIAPIEHLNKALHTCHARGDKGIFFCTSQRVAETKLCRVIIRWKSPNSIVFLAGRLTEIVDSDSPSGQTYMADLDGRPWGDLNDHTGGSVLRITQLRIIDPTPELEALKHIQSCKYLQI
jgi:hypothetical protein